MLDSSFHQLLKMSYYVAIVTILKKKLYSREHILVCARSDARNGHSCIFGHNKYVNGLMIFDVFIHSFLCYLIIYPTIIFFIIATHW